jgi:hypothetical protein
MMVAGAEDGMIKMLMMLMIMVMRMMMLNETRQQHRQRDGQHGEHAPGEQTRRWQDELAPIATTTTARKTPQCGCA